MRLNSKGIFVMLLCSCLFGACESKPAQCDTKSIVQYSQIPLLSEAEVIECDKDSDSYALAVFGLDDKQLREILDSGNFQSDRREGYYPLKWGHLILDREEEILTHSFDFSDYVSCKLHLKVKAKQLVVLVTFGNW